MHSKQPSKNQSIDLPKGALVHFRDVQACQAARFYRREQILKKKIKSVVDLNANLQKQIKTHQVEIKDERAGIVFQLGQLTKEMGAKYGHFMEQKLERERFKSNQSSHKAIQSIMQSYQKIQKQSQVLTRVYESLYKINQNYMSHSKSIQDTVIQLQTANRTYQQRMQKALTQLGQEIRRVEMQNNQIQQQTQNLSNQIDGFVTQGQRLKQQQNKHLSKIQRLKRLVLKQQQRFEEVAQWSQVVIDMQNRKVVFNSMNQKKEYIDKLRRKNQHLEMHLAQLEQEELMLKRQKEEKENVAKMEKPKTKAKKKV